ncbi:MAG: PAS domain S-box protein [Candidatus Lindowbacteria bacterium]|nr:PAS domain S-box protein [Candidatus Lindowbacteria bacterium]
MSTDSSTTNKSTLHLLMDDSKNALSLLQSTLESTADGILVVTLSGKIVMYNQKFGQMWHIPDEILDSGDDESAIKFVLDQLIDPKQFIAQVESLYDRPESESFDVLHFKDGRTFERVSVPQNVDGKAVGRVWCFRDVTTRNRAEHALSESEREFRTMVQNLPGFVYRCRFEEELVPVFVSDKIQEILGYDPVEMLEKKISIVDDIVHPDDRENFINCIMNAMKNKTSYSIIARALRSDGEERWLWDRGTPVYQEDGTFVALEGFVSDITHEKELEQFVNDAKSKTEAYAHGLESAQIEMLRTTQKLEEASKQKNNFLAIVGHELRTPLAAIQGAMQSLELSGGMTLNDKEKTALSLLSRNTARLNRLCENLNYITRITAKELSTYREKSDLSLVTREVIVDLCEYADQHKVKIEVDLPDQAIQAEVDPNQYNQIVSNLLVNAIRFASSEAKVVLSHSGDSITLLVIDDGPGIPLEDRGRLFEAYTRLDAFSNQTRMGLGLAVVKSLTEAHDGEVEILARSDGKEGSIFRITLPGKA